MKFNFIKTILRKLLPYSFFCFIRISYKGLLKKHIKQKKQSKIDRKLKASDIPVYLSIVAIVKNEVQYIAEWIEYHLLIGVQKFFIYDNESSDNLKNYLVPYINEGIVEYIFFPGKRQQVNAYNDAILKFKLKSFWLAFIDIDEFFVPVSTTNLCDFLFGFEDIPGIEINQLVYGSNGHKTKENGLVIERFKNHSFNNDVTNRLVKSIVNPRRIFFIKSAHEAEYFISESSVNSHKNKNKTNWAKRHALHDKLYYNHYRCKSLEEFVSRIDLGRASSQGKLSPEIFERRDRNDIKNDPVMDKYIPIVKEQLIKRGF